MKFLALFMGFIFAVQMTWCPMADSATELTVTSGGGVQGQVPCNKIGALLLADGLTIMNGSNIEVQGKGPDGKSQTQLTGTVFKVEKIGGSSGTITGSAYFNDGPGLTSLDAVSCGEKVELSDGTTVGGPISSITGDTITAAGRSIPLSQVLKIHSTRVFNFRMKATNAQRISFEATCLHAAATTKTTTKTTTTKSTGGENWVKRHPFWTVTIIAVVGCGIACAIAIPIACSQHGGHHSSAPIERSSSPPPSSSNPFSSSGC